MIYAAPTTTNPAGPTLPHNELRVGFDSRGRWSASRFPEGDGALVLFAERPPPRPVRRPSDTLRQRESSVLEGGRYRKERGRTTGRYSYGRADGPPPIPKALPPVVHFDEGSVAS